MIQHILFKNGLFLKLSVMISDDPVNFNNGITAIGRHKLEKEIK